MKNNLNKIICCIGAGYVGGPTMSVIAKNCPEWEINVVDLNSERINAWNNKDLSKLPIFEPGLEQIVKQCRGKNLFFSTEIEKNIAKADIIFISVNTPTKTRGIGAGYASDLKWIESSARQIAKFSKNHTIIIEKSTLPVKTAETIKTILNSSEQNNASSIGQKTQTFSIISNPTIKFLIGSDNSDLSSGTDFSARCKLSTEDTKSLTNVI